MGVLWFGPLPSMFKREEKGGVAGIGLILDGVAGVKPGLVGDDPRLGRGDISGVYAPGPGESALSRETVNI